MTELNLQFSSHMALKGPGSKPQPSNHMVDLSSRANPHPETIQVPTMSHLISINSGRVWGVHQEQQRLSYHLGKSNNLEALSQ